MAFDVDGPVGRAMQKMATSSWFRTVGPKVVPPMDRVLNRLTGGRVVVSSLLVPSMVLTSAQVASTSSSEGASVVKPRGFCQPPLR